MKVVIQRVDKASVMIHDHKTVHITKGFVILVGFEKDDSDSILPAVAKKIITLRAFEDDDGKMNLSIKDVNGSLLLVPNFTLAADCTKGNRPSFDSSLAPEKAQQLFDTLVNILKESSIPMKTGIFGEHMHISLTNNGPVTFIWHF